MAEKKKYKIEKEWKPVIKKWVKALRSGKYKQGSKALANYELDEEGEPTDTITGYCCLGLLGKLQGCKWTKDSVFLDDDGRNSHVENLNLIPDQLRGGGVLPDMLAMLNDGNEGKNIKKKSFKGIAQWIERNIEFV